jgi:DNA-binding IclR family transcriptional regulator
MFSRNNPVPMGENTSGRTVSTANKTFEIIEFIDSVGSARLNEIATQLDIANSTAHDHLSTLVNCEYLVKNGYEYQLGLKFLSHGIRVRNQYEVYEAASSSLSQIAEKTGEIVWLVTEEYGRAVYLDKALGEAAIQPYGTIGGRVDLHSIAAGKSILAHLPEDRVNKIIDKWGLNSMTEHTITDSEELKRELDVIRSQGYALNDEESMLGFRAVGAPILVNETPVGSIAVSGPKNRISDDKFEQKFPEIVSGTTNAIELSLVSST